MNFSPLLHQIRALHAVAPGRTLALHAPVFSGNEAAYVQECIDSTFVSSVGSFVDRFESMLRDRCDGAHVVATVNGTSALHMALLLAGVGPGDLVLTQALTFVATANAIAYTRAEPVFLDVDADTMGLSPGAVEAFLRERCRLEQGVCRHRETGRRVAACVPMHTFGHACRVEDLAEHCQAWGIVLVEDAAEALGSRYRGRSLGSFGTAGALSFNGNKICTAGGGGAILTRDRALRDKAKHLTTTAKTPHPWEYVHDAVGYNYRLPNLNAALACAQLEQLDAFIADKRALWEEYRRLDFAALGELVAEPEGCVSNGWLHALLLHDPALRDPLLEAARRELVHLRPVWRLLHRLPMYAHCHRDALTRSLDIEARLVNLPSGARPRQVRHAA